ncbi:serine/threonine-protein kinase [Tahibacter caeni]|uniref:serine/threonine-protein kinase n=1 Tax=Tahibacter caeni TaxID=1453545 RepID=UPI0021474B52|nr:serine/threonine-protein kinase [Tahibacter caeni]
MNSTPFQRIKQIFDAAADLPPAERSDYLRQQADLADDTRRQIEDLLRADDAVQDAATYRAIAGDARRAQAENWKNRRIGAYCVDDVLGRGGMGSVFLAHRADGSIAQKVAIKVVRPELLGAATLARFRVERQVLALLQHPNIAAMLDLGELPDASPYIVMAYVEGLPIDRYVRERGLDTTACLRLFLPICDAVAFAHRNLIVHRDLKPGNVLVDAEGRPQLLDFGIAKPLLSQIGSVDVEHTDAEQRFLSLSHAAPEQVANEPITTACDVYGLGVLLYELLAGHAPFQRDGQTPAQLAVRILDEDAVAPSQAGSAGGRAHIAHDVDLIVLRCLRKRPADRYASVEQLADDIRRYLDGRPVAARQGDLLYRAGRFFARHRAAVSLVGVLVVAAALGGAIYLRQRNALAREQQRADDMTGLITDALRMVDPVNASGRDMSAREVFERVAAQAQASPALDAASRTNVLGSIAQIDLSLGLPGEALALLERMDAASSDAATRDTIALLKARALIALSRVDEARSEIAAGLAQSPTGSDAHRRWQLLDASTDLNQGSYEPLLAKLEPLIGENWPAALAEERDNLQANALWQEGRADEAIAALQRTLTVQQQRFGAGSPATFDTLLLLARRKAFLGKLDEADELFAQLLAISDRYFSRHSVRYAGVMALGGTIETRREHLEKAIEYITEGQKIHIAQTGENSGNVASAHLNLASINEALGRHEEAARRYLAAVAVAERIWQASDPNLLLFRTAAATYLTLQDRRREAYPIARRALADVQANPNLGEYDALPLIVFIADFCLLDDDDSPGQRAVVARDLHQALEAAESHDIRSAAEQLVKKARERGIEPKP